MDTGVFIPLFLLWDLRPVPPLRMPNSRYILFFHALRPSSRLVSFSGRSLVIFACIGCTPIVYRLLGAFLPWRSSLVKRTRLVLAYLSRLGVHILLVFSFIFIFSSSCTLFLIGV
jgi:hypothetical protein